ncbi:transporter substrate-binding domain-containing protein [Jeongeupella avenae]|uniref:Transporter substrate-binding domain-containing protein n=2 Tax=Antarcticirhabdus aurantiaca TaxID=2606717 RepID=A0ACD4NNX7_9HYPH|nr:transporter substrate-binding domain-containing protein [Antarcticirhabdus aurantiaca]WAJ28325.1 transporter substrate-binding domain-containing protein [Jeongeuplla avenae]
MIRMKLAALAVAAFSLSASGASAEMLTVGANVGNLPWEFQDQSGEIVGFEVDLATEVAKRLGYDGVDIQNIPFNGLFSAVQSGRIDAAISSITITQERLKSVSFAQPYYDSDQSLSTRTDSEVKGLDTLKGKTVGVDTGSTGDIWATAHQAEYGIGEIRRYEGLQPAMLDLAGGRLDGYISDIPAVAYYIKDKPELAVVARIPTGEQYSMMFAKDSELTSKASEAITALKNEGFVAQIHEKWFGSKPDAGTSSADVRETPKLQ